MIHPKRDLMLASAAEALMRHMHALDPTTAASAAMSKHKADKAFFEMYEELLRLVLTGFTRDKATAMVDAYLEAMEGGEFGDGAPA